MRSLYFRVFLITLYTIIISSFLGFYIANVYYHCSLKPYQDAKLFETVLHLKAHIERHPEAMGDLLHTSAMLGYQLYAYDEAGNDYFYGRAFGKNDLSADVKKSVLEGNEYHGVAEYPNKPFASGYFDSHLSNSVGVHVTAGAERYALFLRHDSNVHFDELRKFFLLMFVMTVLFSVPYFMLSTRYLVQPIIQLKEATKRIAQGRYNLRLPTKRKDEIGQLASHFQKMSLELERADRRTKEFVANVSHEIHSPLASIQGYADSLLGKDTEPDRIRQYAAIIGQETRHLATLSRQLLLLSMLEHPGHEPEKKSFPLQPQLRQTLQLLEWQLAEKEIAVRLLIPSGLHVYGDEVLLMQVWSNLLSNAVKHIPAGRSIQVQAHREDGCCVMTIADTGDGIPEEELPLIYDRFYRGDKSRERKSGSIGLGLSIVQHIVHQHGGTIEAQSRPGVGTTFVVRLPDE
ncbi:sensor histidine kinase [Paenibacillus eucommiae]|uniref:Heme sensor protein HssS n=1 Tax=Paenibacillus eucommiae TaxID=1355755 RepID=A0ABS4J2Y4_9BACL|nr:HAMP domain-containing sensor histidine kinase [Paenibacillus eucommiae]MBP1993179.1 signal transduction histidine kinase [Paenibacillus eucommiae]